jgi:hypothetical protein
MKDRRPGGAGNSPGNTLALLAVMYETLYSAAAFDKHHFESTCNWQRGARHDKIRSQRGAVATPA